jgi:hypothetical protein
MNAHSNQLENVQIVENQEENLQPYLISQSNVKKEFGYFWLWLGLSSRRNFLKKSIISMD